ncbi:MAG: PQQ-dependent sugar dehydrogenase [Candidatus Hydrogenedentes bacterium]|nr:PQQ-dependent sugar dehydrogenase [Candidatus Hydrogenedentota bacterium]
MRVQHRAFPLAFTLITAILLPACDATSQLGLELVVSGLDRPLFLTAPEGDADRLFIVEQDGVIQVVANGSLLPTPFLDLTALVDASANEEGLLGMAFHPDYLSNGLFYVNYTTTVGGTQQHIAQYAVQGDPATSNVANAASETIIVTLPKPFENHNAGMLAFGPDGMLYAATGDGGSGNDPNNNGQNRNSRLGKILRIDVDSGAPYVPADNPFVGMVDHEELIWAYGLRNPWRFSFDRMTGDMFIGDVGQNTWEELDFLPADSTGGENLGWKLAEGFECRGGGGACGTDPGFTPPIHAYRTDVDGDSVVGGYVYRGAAFPALQGAYFFGDSGFSRVWSLRYDPESGDVSELQERTVELELSGQDVSFPASFGEDGVGELYLVNLSGTIHRITGPAVDPEPNVIKANIPDGFVEAGARLELTAPAGSAYQWKKDGSPVLPDGGRITGITSVELIFDPVEQDDAGTYTCAYDDGAKAAAETEPYTLNVLPVGSLPAINSVLMLFVAVVFMMGGISAVLVKR